MSLILLLVVIGSAFWVFTDARAQIEAGRKLSPITSAGGWFWACFLLWIVFFPWYLIKKSQNPNSVKPTLTRIVEQVVEPLRTHSLSAFTGSIADEVKKFAELRDQGVISEEDFDLQRKKLLGS